MIEFEFKVTGMTCVNCSNNIERKMHGAFDEKEMSSVCIVLLVHKMIVIFPQRVFNSRAVTPQDICDFVTGIGFKCELLGMTEISSEQRRNRNLRTARNSDVSQDSLRIRGIYSAESEIEG
mmetsp:Transcript_1882/g.2715  ORF Transcript_1882/g.2715 Transcript_1882/m.2715 type:complete len:121 (+) Transcript_1882:144-506(+)